MIEIIEKQDALAPQGLILDGVCSSKQLKTLRVIDVLELRCRLDLAHTRLVHWKTQEPSDFVGDLEQRLNCSTLAGRSGNDHIDARVPPADEVKRACAIGAMAG